MATIGLKIADSPDSGASLGLADVLAKGIFGDPEGQMKARALAAQVGAHQAYAANLAGEDAQEDQNRRSRGLRAGPLVGGDAAMAAVPMPVPVDALNPLVAGPEGWTTRSYPPCPGQSARIGTSTTAWWRASGRSGRSSSEAPPLRSPRAWARITAGRFRQRREQPGPHRQARTLLQAHRRRALHWHRAAHRPRSGTRASHGRRGSRAPARRSRWTPPSRMGSRKTGGDDAGIYSIGKDATGKPTPSLLSGGPGPVSKAPELKKDAAGNDIQWDPTTQRWVPAPGGATASPDKQEIRDENGTPMVVERDPKTGKVIGETPVPGGPTKPAPPLYQGKTAKDDALNRIEMIKEKIRNKQTITPQEEALYETDFNLNYGPTTTKVNT